MEIRKYTENNRDTHTENKFRGKNAHEIYNGLLNGAISVEEFSTRYYRESLMENPSYTKGIKIKEAIEGAKKGDSGAIQVVRRLILRMTSNNK